jgi:hypothetical protein
MKVLLDLKRKRLKLLVDEAFGEQRSPRAQQGHRHCQGRSIELQATRGVGIANAA